jgi:hypothetical protein
MVLIARINQPRFGWKNLHGLRFGGNQLVLDALEIPEVSDRYIRDVPDRQVDDGGPAIRLHRRFGYMHDVPAIHHDSLTRPGIFLLKNKVVPWILLEPPDFNRLHCLSFSVGNP